MIRKILSILLVIPVALSVVHAQPIINIETSSQMQNSPMINDRLSFLVPLAYQVGPFQDIRICGTIMNSAYSKTKAELQVYTKIEGDLNYITKKEIEILLIRPTGTKKAGPFEIGTFRYPSTGTVRYWLNPGDQLELCWFLKTGKINKEGKIRAYFYAREPNYNIVREKYSEWITLKPQTQPPQISGWNVNIAVYGGLAALIALSLLRIKGII